MRRGFFLVLALVGTGGFTSAIDLTSVNFRYKYDENVPVSINSRLRRLDDTLRLIFELILTENRDSLPEVKLYLQTDYTDDSERANSPKQLSAPLKAKQGVYRYLYQFVPDTTSNLIVIAITHSDLRTYYFDIPFSEDVNFTPPDFGLLTLDSIDVTLSFALENETYLFSDSALVIFQYDEDFPAASPPMIESKISSKNISIDSAMSYADSFKPARDKLYFVQSDTNSLAGIAILGVPLLYPKLIAIRDLVKPLIYISTTNELEKLKSTNNLKSVLDRFWLDVTGLESRAIDTIKKYYRRVSESNKYFTTYKQGWMTDMGMIYVLFGTPTHVYKTNHRESWIYENLDGKAVEFNFNKIKNLFTSHHYELVRSGDYKDIWYRQVDLWRKGRI